MVDPPVVCQNNLASLQLARDPPRGVLHLGSVVKVRRPPLLPRLQVESVCRQRCIRGPGVVIDSVDVISQHGYQRVVAPNVPIRAGRSEPVSAMMNEHIIRTNNIGNVTLKNNM